MTEPSRQCASMASEAQPVAPTDPDVVADAAAAPAADTASGPTGSGSGTLERSASRSRPLASSLAAPTKLGVRFQQEVRFSERGPDIRVFDGDAADTEGAQAEHRHGSAGDKRKRDAVAAYSYQDQQQQQQLYERTPDESTHGDVIPTTAGGSHEMDDGMSGWGDDEGPDDESHASGSIAPMSPQPAGSATQHSPDAAAGVATQRQRSASSGSEVSLALSLPTSTSTSRGRLHRHLTITPNSHDMEPERSFSDTALLLREEGRLPPPSSLGSVSLSSRGGGGLTPHSAAGSASWRWGLLPDGAFQQSSSQPVDPHVPPGSNTPHGSEGVGWIIAAPFPRRPHGASGLLESPLQRSGEDGAAALQPADGSSSAVRASSRPTLGLVGGSREGVGHCSHQLRGEVRVDGRVPPAHASPSHRLVGHEELDRDFEDRASFLSDLEILATASESEIAAGSSRQGTPTAARRAAAIKTSTTATTALPTAGEPEDAALVPRRSGRQMKRLSGRADAAASSAAVTSVAPPRVPPGDKGEVDCARDAAEPGVFLGSLPSEAVSGLCIGINHAAVLADLSALESARALLLRQRAAVQAHCHWLDVAAASAASAPLPFIDAVLRTQNAANSAWSLLAPLSIPEAAALTAAFDVGSGGSPSLLTRLVAVATRCSAALGGAAAASSSLSLKTRAPPDPISGLPFLPLPFRIEVCPLPSVDMAAYQSALRVLDAVNSSSHSR